jgi:formylglycine-generating enzyme required for sulfatase activity
VRLREWLRFADRDDRQRPAKEARMQAMLDVGVRPAGPRRRCTLDGETVLELTLIPPGSFWMGTLGEESGEGLTETPRHLVTLTTGFWMGVHQLTQRQWHLVMGDTPSHFSGPSCPVETITWSRSKECCAQLGKRLGGRFRLPSEAEWEYACRAGTYSAYHSGNDEAALARAGWYVKNSEGRTMPVGQLTPNAWGLYDMHGSVYEWCADRFRTYTAEAVTNPFGRETDSHCIRGGYWGRPPLSCRSAYRDGYVRGAQASIAGFRVVRDLDRVRRARRAKE